MVLHAPKLTSNISAVFIVLLFLSACANNDERKDNDTSAPNFKEEDTLALVQTFRDTVQHRRSFRPDSTINSKLKLNDNLSAKEFTPNKIELIYGLRETPVAVFCNATKTEFMMAYQYEGNPKNSFSCFEIGYIDNEVLRGKCIASKENFFTTESGIKLGMSLESLIAIKGIDYTLSAQNEIVTYKLNPSSDFSRKHNMPGYFLEFNFKKGNIIKMKFGFDYP